MAKKQRISQKERFLNFMGQGRTLSTKQAKTMFHAHKPSARVWELRNEGYEITSTTNKVGNFAYVLDSVA
jgi:hypothetical protein